MANFPSAIVIYPKGTHKSRILSDRLILVAPPISFFHLMTTGIVQALVIDQDNRMIILHSYMYLGSRVCCVVVICGVSSSFQLSSLPLHNATEGFKEKCQLRSIRRCSCSSGGLQDPGPPLPFCESPVREESIQSSSPITP